jgi:Tol biopolymer transport system component
MSKTFATTPLVFLLAVLWTPPAATRAAAAARVEPVNLAVNTAANEDDPHVAGDGLTLYYASDAKGKYDIMFATRKKATDPWGRGDVLQDYIRTGGDDRGVYVTTPLRFPQLLYFASKDKGASNFDLFVAAKQGKDKAFAEVRAVAAVDTEEDEMHPWLAARGRELYFSRKTKDGWRVCVSRRRETTGPAGWGPPDVVEELPPDFHHATLTPDGTTMYLQGPLPGDRWGLFVSTLSGKTWGTPRPLQMLNDPAGKTGDLSPALTHDGRRLYFASDRPRGKGGLDLWTVGTAELGVR